LERILTKEEIAELLSAVKEGEIRADSASDLSTPEGSVTRLDLVRASLGSSRWQNSNFEVILNSFSRNCGISLTNRLQRSVTIKQNSINASEFDPFALNLDNKGSIGVIPLDPLTHGGLFVFDSTLSYALVETMLGGTLGSSPIFPSRSLTAIEMNLIKNVMENACHDLRKAFQPLEALSTSLVRIESDPRMVNFVPPETELMIIEFIVTIDSITGMMNLVIPYSSLEPLREKIKDGMPDLQASQSTSWSRTLQEAVISVETGITAQLGELTLPIKEIIDLQVGDIIDLDYDPNTPLRVLVETKPKFFAMSGVHNGKKAVRITGNLEQGEYNEIG